MEMHVGDIGRSDDFEILLLQLLIEKLGDQVFDHLLADIALELLTNEAGRRLARAEAVKFSALLERTDDALGLGIHGFHRDRNFKRMPATFY
jgi:hypothetical protein